MTYLRDDQILNAAKVARASGQNQPLINLMPAEALNASIPSSYPASAKKLGLIPDEVEMMQEMTAEEAESLAGSSKVEEEQIPVSANQISGSINQISSSSNQIPEPSNQMILSSEHLEQVSPDIRNQVPLELGAQVTVDLQNQIQVELRSQIPADLRCHIPAELRNQMAADIRNQIPAELRNQLSGEHAVPLVSSSHHIPFSAGHYIPAVSTGHHIPLSGGHHLMPMMVAPQVPVSAGNYEDVKDNVPVGNLTMIG